MDSPPAQPRMEDGPTTLKSCTEPSTSAPLPESAERMETTAAAHGSDSLAVGHSNTVDTENGAAGSEESHHQNQVSNSRDLGQSIGELRIDEARGIEGLTSDRGAERAESSSRRRYPPRHSSYNALFTPRSIEQQFGSAEGAMQTLLDFLRQSEAAHREAEAERSGTHTVEETVGRDSSPGYTMARESERPSANGANASAPRRRSSPGDPSLRLLNESTSRDASLHSSRASTLPRNARVAHSPYESYPSHHHSHQHRPSQSASAAPASLMAPSGLQSTPLSRDTPEGRLAWYQQHIPYTNPAPSSSTQPQHASSPPLPRYSRDSPIVLPPWQPDDEVTHCFNCNRKFTFLFRKHHCRKCGRVVCASCSPHRITIPRQYVVLHPDEVRDRSARYGDSAGAIFFDTPLSRESSSVEDTQPSPVRVCNPCVPDPNFSPPPPPYTADRPDPTPSRPRAGTNTTTPEGQHSSNRNRSEADVRLHSARQDAAVSASSRRRASSLHHPSPAHPDAPDVIPTRRRHRRPPIREEDECPVCGRELPPLGPSGSDDQRVAHVNACLMAQISAAGGSPRSPSVPQPPTSSTPGEGQQPGSAPVVPVSAAARGLLKFSATEKDTLPSSDGKPAECDICFEEYVVGERLARLVCLCRFHERCVEGWWRVQGRRRGDCPTHWGGII